MKKAEVGSKASFCFASGHKLFGIIKHIPVATGDSWIVEEIHEGKEIGTVYIQQFEFMFLR